MTSRETWDAVIAARSDAPAEGILAEAERLTSGDRQAAYGHPLDDYTRTGRMWGAILGIGDIPAETCCLMMAAVKISREVNQHGRDNLVDGVGYLRCVGLVHDERTRREGTE